MSVTCQPHVTYLSATSQLHVSNISATVTCQPCFICISNTFKQCVRHMSAICQVHAIWQLHVSHSSSTSHWHFIHVTDKFQQYVSHMSLIFLAHVCHKPKTQVSPMSARYQPRVSHISLICKPIQTTCKPHVSHILVICQQNAINMSVTCQVSL